MGKLLIITGLALAACGGLMMLEPNLLSRWGTLPGDIRIEGERVKFYFPITSMLLTSIAISLVLSVIARFLNR